MSASKYDEIEIEIVMTHGEWSKVLGAMRWQRTQHHDRADYLENEGRGGADEAAGLRRKAVEMHPLIQTIVDELQVAREEARSA